MFLLVHVVRKTPS